MNIEDIVEGGYYLVYDEVYHVVKFEEFVVWNKIIVHCDILDKMGNVIEQCNYDRYLSRQTLAYLAEKRVQPRAK